MYDEVVIHHLSVNGHRALARYGSALYPCCLGASGIRRNKCEGDRSTPAGAWSLRYLLYRADRMTRPRTRLPVFAIKPEDGWCDDPASSHYNKPVTLPSGSGHERLWRDDSVYDLLIVTDHNQDPAVSGRGSAIFVHLQRPDGRATEGCIAFRRNHLLHLIQTWSVDTRIVVPG
jgi:L,D-peptidoglycan transpeptidase YkuD (ErfK/YbiS/YcfS/YnhG family)